MRRACCRERRARESKDAILYVVAQPVIQRVLRLAATERP